MRSTFVLLLIIMVLISRQAAAQNESTAVIELFTSQSCSSCPPADALMARLAAANPDLIVLSCPVTYWNHLSWRDTLSQEFCSARQNAYAIARQDDRIFTPEALINGENSIIASNKKLIYAALATEAGSIQTITIKKAENGFTADLTDIQPRDFTLAVFGKSHTQDITRGENSGVRVEYTNPIIAIHYLTTTSLTLDVPSSLLPTEAAGFAILGQTGHQRINAAGQFKLH